jgi:hypothetical protein
MTAAMTDQAVTRIVAHKKRGTRYEVLGTAKLQTEFPLHDYAEVVVYRSVDDSSELWARERAEFEDGRFRDVAVHPVPQPEEERDGASSEAELTEKGRKLGLEQAAQAHELLRKGILDYANTLPDGGGRLVTDVAWRHQEMAAMIRGLPETLGIIAQTELKPDRARGIVALKQAAQALAALQEEVLSTAEFLARLGQAAQSHPQALLGDNGFSMVQRATRLRELLIATPANMSEGARTSTTIRTDPEGECQLVLLRQGQPYPKTCPRCALGPCTNPVLVNRMTVCQIQDGKFKPVGTCQASVTTGEHLDVGERRLWAHTIIGDDGELFTGLLAPDEMDLKMLPGFCSASDG